MKSIAFIAIFLGCLFIASCSNGTEEKRENGNLSVSKYSEVTKINYEETADGYKGAFMKMKDIDLHLQSVKNYFKTCKSAKGYYQYTIADPESWDLFIYYPLKDSAKIYDSFKFTIDDGVVKVYVTSKPATKSSTQADYILICIQSPHRGPVWPKSSEIFIDGTQIKLIGEDWDC